MTVIAFMGRSGTGKDTAAEYLQDRHGYTTIAFAEPLKRLAKIIYRFSDEQLYGPPSARNAVDERFWRVQYAEEVFQRLYPVCPEAVAVLEELFPEGVPERAPQRLIAQFLEDIAPNGHAMTARKVLQLLGTEWGRGLQPDLWLRALQRAVSLRPGEKWAVTDCRFPNEAELIARNIPNGYVLWVDADRRVPVDPVVSAHSSEPKYEDVKEYVHRVVDNNGTREEYERNIESALNGLTAW